MIKGMSDPGIIDLDAFTGWATDPTATAAPGQLVLEAMERFTLDLSAEEVAFTAALPKPAEGGPWCRVTGRVILPAARALAAVGTGVQVTLTPVPARVTATVDGELVIVSAASPIRVFAAADGRITDGYGNPYVDVIGCGAGVTPAGDWDYQVTIKGAGVAPLVGRATLRAGETVNLASVFQAA